MSARRAPCARAAPARRSRARSRRSPSVCPRRAPAGAKVPPNPNAKKKRRPEREEEDGGARHEEHEEVRRAEEDREEVDCPAEPRHGCSGRDETRRPKLVCAACNSVLAALLLLTLAACSKNAAAPADAGSSSSTASLTLGADASFATSTPDAAVGGPCQLEAGPFVLDKGVRSETGVTLVRLADGRLAAGYANGEGRPKVATFDLDGVPTLFDVDIANLPELGQKPAPRTTRSVHRVTPLGTSGITMRAAVDVSEGRGQRRPQDPVRPRGWRGRLGELSRR